MLKKASTVAAVVAGLMMVGGPAFAVAGEPHEHSLDTGDGYGAAIGEFHSHTVEVEGEEGNYADQFGLLNFADDSDVAGNINLCEVEVNVIAIPILAQNDESYCINTDNDDNDDNDSHHDH